MKCLILYSFLVFNSCQGSDLNGKWYIKSLYNIDSDERLFPFLIDCPYFYFHESQVEIRVGENPRISPYSLIDSLIILSDQSEKKGFSILFLSQDSLKLKDDNVILLLSKSCD